jgi:hypothetical protein
MRARGALAVLALLLGGPGIAPGCAASQPRGGDTAGADAAPVDLALVGVDGRRFALSQLRGRPLLLFLFTTYDSASQLALTPLTRFLSAHPDLPALGIAAQPDPSALLPLYRDALELRMPLAYEVSPQIVAGDSMLGRLETVPSYVLLDASGRITARHTGALTGEQLEDFAEPALP